MASKRKPPVLTSRVRQRQQPLRLKIGQDDYDRAQVLAQLATDLSAHRDIRDSVLFKGGAVLQMGHRSPRYSRDLDATAVSQKPIRKNWVNDVLEAQRLGKMRGYVKSHQLVVQGKRLFTKQLTCLAASGNEIGLKIEINWSEPPMIPAGERLTITAHNRDPVSLRAMHRTESATEKLRALLTRAFAGDAYDLYYYRSHVLSGEQFAAVRHMIPEKFAYERTLRNHPDLPRLFDEQVGVARQSYESGGVVIAGNAPAWSTVADALRFWRDLLV